MRCANASVPSTLTFQMSGLLPNEATAAQLSMRHLFQTRIVQKTLRLAEIADEDIPLSARPVYPQDVEFAHVLFHALQPFSGICTH
jgi:hypothetical protein